MTTRQNTEDKPAPRCDETTQPASTKPKPDEKRRRFDALADEEPQICRSID